jgi:hypothetical protein
MQWFPETSCQGFVQAKKFEKGCFRILDVGKLWCEKFYQGISQSFQFSLQYIIRIIVNSSYLPDSIFKVCMKNICIGSGSGFLVRSILLLIEQAEHLHL